MPSYQRYRTLTPAAPKAVETTREHRSLRRFSVFSLILFLVTTSAFIYVARRSDAHAAAEAARRQQQKSYFADYVNKVISENPEINLSVSATDLHDNKIQSLGQQKAMGAASTTKVLTAVYYLKQVESGRQNLNTLLNGKTAKKQLQLMLQQSDDTAWQLLNERLSHSGLETYAHSLGLNSYNADINAISADDMTRLFSDLGSGYLLNTAHTDMLLSYMQHTNYEDFISPAVPAAYPFYHKVGLDEDLVNDTALIQNLQNESLVLTIFTNGNGTYHWTQRALLMQRIASAAIKAYLQ
jgi:beta-lactamase class A